MRIKNQRAVIECKHCNATQIIHESFPVLEMTCAACAVSVESTLKGAPGIKNCIEKQNRKVKIMETKKFKTNIKCSGCVATVSPHLNDAVGEANWTVDIADPSKILSVKGDTNESKIIEAVQKAGFKIEKVKSS